MSAQSRTRQRALVGGLVGLAACLVWAWFDRAAFFRSYLIAWLFLIAISAGSMANLMIHDLTGGRWGAVLRPPLEAAVAAMPLLAVLALPLALGLPELYPWARPDAGANEVIAAKAWYLNGPFFLLRAIVILGTWSAFALALRRDWRARRVGPAPKPERQLSIVGLIVYFLTVTIAAVDWIASLTPAWYSSAIGLRVGVAQTTAAFAFCIPAAAWLVGMNDDGDGAPQDRQDLGNLLLMFVMLWAYIAFTEFLIIWAEDIPHETAFFLPRATTSWRWLAIVLVVVEFGVPMFAMLFRAIKRRTRALAAIGLLVLLGQWLDTLWLVAPAFRPAGFAVSPLDGLATLGLGGVWLWYALRALDRATPAPLATAGIAQHG